VARGSPLLVVQEIVDIVVVVVAVVVVVHLRRLV
jgi:hypothetical protein